MKPYFFLQTIALAVFCFAFASCREDNDLRVICKLPWYYGLSQTIDSLDYTVGDETFFLNDDNAALGVVDAYVYSDFIDLSVRITIPRQEPLEFQIKDIHSETNREVIVFNGQTNEAVMTEGEYMTTKQPVTVFGWIKLIRGPEENCDGKISLYYPNHGKECSLHISRMSPIREE